MRTLLRIDGSARRAGSLTRLLCDHAVERWRAAHPSGRVVQRCLVQDPVPHLDDGTIASWHGGPATAGSALSQQLIDELFAADDLVLGVPVYNFGVPSPVKAWLDHVVCVGRTVTAENGRFRGLLGGRRAMVVTARGGPGSIGDGDDHVTPHLRRVLSFVGIEDVEVIGVVGVAVSDEHRDQAMAVARQRIAAAVADSREPEWVGDVTPADRREIARLRAGQAAAILAGDALAYAELCADDVELLLPGRDPVRGRDALLACERDLFRATRFVRFDKRPERIECGPQQAIEIGRQTVGVESTTASGAFVAPRQKYLHIYRRTPSGWRFSFLMSNAS